MRQKRISESGSQQLLLDAYTIKTLLLQLHSLDVNASKGGVITGSGGSGSSSSVALMSGGDSGGGGGGVSGGGSKGGMTAITAAPPMYTKLITTKVSHSSITSCHITHSLM